VAREGGRENTLYRGKGPNLIRGKNFEGGGGKRKTTHAVESKKKKTRNLNYHGLTRGKTLSKKWLSSLGEGRKKKRGNTCLKKGTFFECL